MIAPILQLTSAATIEISDIAVAITVESGTPDHHAVESAYRSYGQCRLFHDQVFTLVKLVDARASGAKTIYLGVI